MGNVSLAMPSIHPCIGIESAGAVNHQPEFAAACINASADRAVLEGSLALAWTAIDIANGPARARLLGESRVVLARRADHDDAVGGLAAGRSRIRERLDGRALADGGRECGRFLVETGLAHDDVAGLLTPGPVGRLALVRVPRELEVVGHLLAEPCGAPPFSTSTESSAGVFAGTESAVVSVVAFVVSVAPAVVAVVSLLEPEPFDPWFVSPSSTTLSSTTPMITASAMRPAPFAAAKLAPRATVFPLPRPPVCRLMRPFCPVRALGALTVTRDRPDDLRDGRVAAGRAAAAAVSR